MKFTFLKRLITITLLLISSVSVTYAGRALVQFGAPSPVGDCTGTGICIIGDIGVSVEFVHHEYVDSMAQGAYSSLVMIFDYDIALLYGFVGGTRGGSYMFTGGYTFDHHQDAGLGIPHGYSIPKDYVATLTPVAPDGKVKIIVTQFVPF